MTKAVDWRERFRECLREEHFQAGRARAFKAGLELWRRVAVGALVADLALVSFAGWEGWAETRTERSFKKLQAEYAADEANISRLVEAEAAWKADWEHEHERALANRGRWRDCEREADERSANLDREAVIKPRP